MTRELGVAGVLVSVALGCSLAGAYVAGAALTGGARYLFFVGAVVQWATVAHVLVAFARWVTRPSPLIPPEGSEATATETGSRAPARRTLRLIHGVRPSG